jgi:hypothetical protein
MTFTDPGFDIQRDIVAALKANAAVKAMVKDRVYDRVPRDRNGDPNVPFPYITLGGGDVLRHPHLVTQGGIGRSQAIVRSGRRSAS